MSSIQLVSFFIKCYDDHLALHSFPTRRSSDLFAALIQTAQQVEDFLAGLRIEISGGFVSQNHERVIGERPGDGHTLLLPAGELDRKSTRLNSSHSQISYAVFCLKKKRYKLEIV